MSLPLEHRILIWHSAEVKHRRFYCAETNLKDWWRGALFALQRLQQLCPSMQKIQQNLHPSRRWCNLLRFWSEHHNQRRRASDALCKSAHTHTHTHTGKGGRCVWTGQSFTTKREDRQTWNALRSTLKPSTPLKGATLKVKIKTSHGRFHAFSHQTVSY